MNKIKYDFSQMKFALVAHDNKKADMVAFVTKRLDFFNREDVDIVTTGTTGAHCEHAGITKVQKLLSGPLGGDAQIAAMVIGLPLIDPELSISRVTTVSLKSKSFSFLKDKEL